jgi:hypothetical protein
VFEFSVEQLRFVGWRPFEDASFVGWCGHAQEVILVPEAEGGCFMIPVLAKGQVKTLQPPTYPTYQ